MADLNLEPLKLVNESFTIDGYEKALLNGTYTIKTYWNPHPDLKKVFDDYWDDQPSLFHAKRIYMCGNILYKTDEPNIEELIDLIIHCTHAKKLPDYVDASVHEKTQMRGGTICPTKEVIFRHKGKLFILYGRYIYGYDKRYVRFFNDNIEHKDDENDDDDDEYEDYDDEYQERMNIYYGKELDPLLSRDEIIVPRIKIKDRSLLDDYTYAFSIIDEKSGVLNAFAIFS